MLKQEDSKYLALTFQCLNTGGNDHISTAFTMLRQSVKAIIYAVSQNKTHIQSFCNNFGKYRWILIILSPLHSVMISRKSFYIIHYRVTSNLLPHYLEKFERSTVQAYRIVVQFSMTWSQSYVYADSFTILQHVLQVSAISTHVCFESCTPIVNICVNDALHCAMLS